jgi:phytoene synthase
MEEDFLAVIAGMEMDAGARLRIADGEMLEIYCDRVACAVGRLSNRVFGLDGQKGDDLAKSLGEALQLTNILRDIDEDAARDHVYLPADLLARHGIATDRPDQIVYHENLAAAAGELAERAARRFQEAARIMADCNRKTIRPALVMMAFYSRLFDRLRARGWHDRAGPVKLGRFEKFWLVLRFGLL